MEDLPTLLSELAKVGPFVVLLGWLVWKFMGKSETSDKALIDYLANKQEGNINALNRAADGSESVAKAVEALSKQLGSMQTTLDQLAGKLGK